MSTFKINDYQFVTMDENGEVGSIYFSNGRIRLLHSAGPKIEAGRTGVLQRIMYQRKFFSEVSVSLITKDITKVNAMGIANAYLHMAENARIDTTAMKGEIQKLDKIITTSGSAPSMIISMITVIAKYAALGCQLFETFNVNGKGMQHPSRGIPVRLPLGMSTQEELDDLCNLITTQDTEQFRMAIYKANKTCYDYCQAHEIGLFLHQDLID